MKLKINDQDWGSVPDYCLSAIQFFCVENQYHYHWNKEEQTVEVNSSLHGKKVWLSVNTSNESINEKINKKVKEVLIHYGIDIAFLDNSEGLSEGDLLIELVSGKTKNDKRFVSFGYNEKLNPINVKKILSIYKDELQFNGYYLLPESHSIPHLRCSIQCNDEEFLLNESPAILTNCVLKVLLGNQKPTLLDLNVLHLLKTAGEDVEDSGKNRGKLMKPARKTQIDDKEYEEIKKQKAKRKIREAEAKKSSAEIYFDYIVLPNRKLERYSIKADLFIKNTGNTDLLNPKICLRMNPPDKIEIGGQILPPEMSDIFSIQGQNGAEGWKYMGEDWLEKAYETGEYWIETIQESTIPPGESIMVEGMQFTLENLEEQETSTILGFVLFEEQGLQLNANNTIRIIF
ncbi:hypothetical protein LS684_20740 (plasmid) [Cytobacillus spongiae]|uniref:hypothetical protein n=1 Tax=Cytobacillus spongiae TaxID=2901381 RepID=UPI001F221BD0|nr:hypothetical protein [Cytobacillus spongiae]UII58058.1 hypothetical protein LS684_20740 [Cytobacillus spongiae]